MRRRSKRMELVRPEDRRRREKERPADELFLTRRAFVFKGVATLGFGALVARLGQMQLAQSGQFQQSAASNIIRPEPLNGARGLIVDRRKRVLAENRISWRVSLIPAEVPDDEQVRSYLRQQLTGTLGLKDQLVVRKSGLPLGQESAVLAGVAAALGADPAKLTARVKGASGPLYVLRADLTGSEAATLVELERRFPGVHVMNWLDYTLEQHAEDAAPVVVAKDVPRDVALGLQQNSLYLPGVQVSDQYLKRRYTSGSVMAHLLGYVGPVSDTEYAKAHQQMLATGAPIPAYLENDDVGRGGLEAGMEEVLRATHGLRWVVADNRGIEIGELFQRRQEAQPGKTVQMTVDLDFQQQVAQALAAGIQNADAKRKPGTDPVGAGVAIALDPRNGEVLAMVSLPTYDNQKFVDGISQADYQAYLDNPFKPLTNFAVSGEFPPGSPIKPLLACAALQEGPDKGGISPTTAYRCAGQFRVPNTDNEDNGHTYVCWIHQPGHGSLDVRRALAESCDIFFYNVGAPRQQDQYSNEALHYYDPDNSKHYFNGLGVDKMGAYLRREFGFGNPTGIELAGEASGLVPDAKWKFQTLHDYWSVGDTINASIGQGYVSATPLQLAAAIAAIANGGSYYRPRLVKALLDGDGNVVSQTEAEKVRQLGFDPAHIQVVREGMRLAVADPSGTAHGKFALTGNDFPIAGKTGTAEFGQAVNGIYAESHAWFACFAPYEAPTIAVVVLIQGGGEGATFAVPVADAILAAYFGKTPPKTA